MGKTIKLVSVLLKCSLGTGTADDHNKKTGKNILNLLLLLCIVPLIYYLFQGGSLLQELFAPIDGDGIMLRFIMFVISAFIFAAGIVSCINTFYLSSNLECLLVMPFTSGQITGAKLIVAAVYEYYISLFILAPVLAGYGYAGREPAFYWVGALMAVVLLPIVPLTTAAVVSMLVMRLLGGSKNKERTAAIGAVGLMGAYMLYDIIRNAVQSMNVSAVEETIADLAQSISRITAVFPDIPFIVNVMVKKDALSILWSLFAAAASIIIFLAAAKLLYLAGAIGMQSASATHKKMTPGQLARVNRRTNILRSYTHKELRIIFRTPAYYIQCLFLTLGWPVLLVVPELFSSSAKNNFNTLMNMFTTEQSSVYFIFLLFCVVFSVTMFAASLNATAPLSISREGQSFLIMKQLPVSYKLQLKAKRNAAFIICGTGSGVYMVIAEIILILWKGFPWWCIPLSIVFNILVLLILLDIEMIYGLVKPKLVWESEGDVASKNTAGFVMFLLGIVAVSVLVIVFGGWVKELSVSPVMFTAGLTGCLCVAVFLIDRLFYFYGVRRLEKL